MGDVQVWKEGASGEPKFPSDFEVVKKAVLQVTDIKTNKNKYYAVELHSAKNKYRVYTHYGRTDDLDTNPNAGMRESRYCSSLDEANQIYNKIFAEKTSARKGYKEVNLASSKIGSKKTIGQSSGIIDDKTLKKLAEKDTDTKKAPTISLHPDIQEVVSYLYSEATNALVNTVNATITANGIETPLGVLTMGQIDKGQVVLDQLVEAFEKKKKSKDELIDLSGEFYTVIPHRFGRSRDQAQLAVLDTADKLNEKQDTLQLMRDMLNVNGKTNVLVNPEIEQKYKALNCEIELVDPGKYKEMKDYFEKSVVRGNGKVKVKNLWQIKRPQEHKEFTTSIGNHKLLFHGSAAKNWVGILSRGLLLPKIVVTLGVHRTDAGWLGSGIYFGDAACTSAAYAREGKKGTKLIAIANVALGKMKDYSKITYGLTKPPDGFDSCHGVRGTQFADNEYVIYNHNQQKLEYLVECTYGY
jgi:Poly(ADP-ribose) polymerase, regulatory domain./WGR domain./Poly(ADP-ribose) polymerase catalytic domain.